MMTPNLSDPTMIVFASLLIAAAITWHWWRRSKK